jgi:membrane associated rhomboid family serine protease
MQKNKPKRKAPAPKRSGGNVVVHASDGSIKDQRKGARSPRHIVLDAKDVKVLGAPLLRSPITFRTPITISQVATVLSGTAALGALGTLLAPTVPVVSVIGAVAGLVGGVFAAKHDNEDRPSKREPSKQEQETGIHF